MDLMYYSRKSDAIDQIGKWERGKGLQFWGVNNKSTTSQVNNGDVPDQSMDANGNSLDVIFQKDSVDPVTLVVVTKEERPYVMLREDRTGNDAYDGFCIDLLKVT